MNALKQMEDFENEQQQKLEPSEMVKESVVEMQRKAMPKLGLRTSRKRRPEADFKLSFAAWRGNTLVVSKKEKRRLDLCRGVYPALAGL